LAWESMVFAPAVCLGASAAWSVLITRLGSGFALRSIWGWGRLHCATCGSEASDSRWERALIRCAHGADRRLAALSLKLTVRS